MREEQSAATNVRGTGMRNYDFSKGKRGPVLPVPPGKERITIRLDRDILEYFRGLVERAGGGNYQTLINNVLRAHLEGAQKSPLEETLRRVIREELRRAS
ncbi:MAG TPA: BrnA antitoxin family protein [Terriglobia bacterium]|nr:BrnA antitoxin family protein [Terriglobia bacterium]